MQSDTQFYLVWAHRGSDSIFGAASHPVIRNGAFLCFDTEEPARAETDRLNARSGGTLMHYSIKPTWTCASNPAPGCARRRQR